MIEASLWQATLSVGAGWQSPVMLSGPVLPVSRTRRVAGDPGRRSTIERRNSDRASRDAELRFSSNVSLVTMNSWTMGALAFGFFALAWVVDSLWGFSGLVVLTLIVLTAPLVLTAAMSLRSRIVGAPNTR